MTPSRLREAQVSLAALVDGIDVDAVAAAVRGCAGVSGLDGGRFGEVATYLPGRQVPGVIVRRHYVLVQVRARWGLRAADLLNQVILAVVPITRGRPVQVVIGDIDEPPAPHGPPPAGPVSGAATSGMAGRPPAPV